MKIAIALTVLLLTLSLHGHAAPSSGLTLQLNEALLKDLEIELQIDGAQATSSPIGPQYQALLATRSVGELQGSTGASRQLSGAVRFDHALLFSVGKHRATTAHFTLVPLSVNPTSFALQDAQGDTWFTLEGGHPHATPDGLTLDVRMLSLRASKWLAGKVKRPGLQRFLLGGAQIGLSLRPDGKPLAGQMCPPEPLRWPTLGFQADVALENIPDVFELRCQGCSVGSTSGTVAIAPSARLRNVGTADVPWFEMFGGTPAPYGADQHPFLVWNLYRQEADGTLRQIGASAVKHAFFSTNSDCPCPGAQVLYAERCTDEYDAFTNDIDSFLTERNEVIPMSGLWARCGSLHDADCNGVRNSGAGNGNGFQRRMNVSESELSAAPGRRFFIEAWYVTRDDINIANSMATREIVPVKEQSSWVFVNEGETRIGPFIERLRPQAPSRPGHLFTQTDTTNGRVALVSSVRALGNGRYRYRYELMNFEFALVRTQGALPNLRLLSHTGIEGFSVPVGSAVPDQFTFIDADQTPANDWSASHTAGRVEFTDLAGNAQSWGRLYSFTFESQDGPTTGSAAITASDTVGALTAQINALIPSSGPADLLFWNEFEGN